MAFSVFDRSISSMPGAAKFRSNVIILLVVLLIGLFLHYTQGLTEKAHLIAKQNVLNDIKYSLSMMLYDFTIKGKQVDLLKFHHENPFIPLGIYRTQPINYAGTKPLADITETHIWFFDKQLKKLGYKQTERVEYWQMNAVKKDGIYQLELKPM